MPNPFLGLRSGFSSSPRGFYYGDSGPARSDLTTQAISDLLLRNKQRFQMEQEQHEANMRGGYGGGGRMAGGGNRLASMFSGGATGPTGQPMNVVYDQRPEMLQKELNFKKDMAAQAQKNIEAERATEALKANDDYIDRRRKNEMAGREQDLRENVANYGMMNPDLKIETVPGGNIVAVNPKTGEVIDTGQSSGQMSDAEKMRIQNENALGQIDRRNAGDLAAANVRANANMQPNAGEMNQRTVDKARELILTNPAYADLIEFSDDGKSFRIKDRPKGSMWSAPPDDSAARIALAKELYGDRNVPGVGGINSAAISGALGSAGVSGDISKRGSPTPSHVTGLPTAPPKSAKPGGKWIKTGTGRTIYVEP